MSGKESVKIVVGYPPKSVDYWKPQKDAAGDNTYLTKAR